MWSLNSMLGLMFRPEGALVGWMNEWIDEWMDGCWRWIDEVR